MLKWLKSKLVSQPDPLEAQLRQLIDAPALATAIAETVAEYFDAVKNGAQEFPIHRKEQASVVAVWSGVRLEALRHLFGYGKSEPFLLSDFREQQAILTSFLDERPQFEMPQPRGEKVPDTIQGVGQVYFYLSNVGSELADRETDRDGLKIDGRSIYDDINRACEAARVDWQNWRAAPSQSKFPKTFIELIYEDVTVKSKSIALSKVYGPFYEDGIKFVENLLTEPSDKAKFLATIKRVMIATDPDHVG